MSCVLSFGISTVDVTAAYKNIDIMSALHLGPSFRHFMSIQFVSELVNFDFGLI